MIPDLTFARRELDIFLDAPPWMPADGVAMVVEITSSQPGRDRDAKRHAYACARIPLPSSPTSRGEFRKAGGMPTRMRLKSQMPPEANEREPR